MKKFILALLTLFVVTAAQADPRTVTVAHTVTAGAYTTGKLVGGLITIPGAIKEGESSTILQSVVIADEAKQAGSYDMYFFTSATGGTYTDTGTGDVSDADLFLGICPISISTVFSSNDNGFVSRDNIGCPIQVASGTTIYALLVAQSSQTYAAITDIQFRFGFVD